MECESQIEEGDMDPLFAECLAGLDHIFRAVMYEESPSIADIGKVLRFAGVRLTEEFIETSGAISAILHLENLLSTSQLILTQHVRPEVPAVALPTAGG